MHGSNNNNVSRRCLYFVAKWIEPVMSRYPVNVAFVSCVYAAQT